MNTKEMSNMFDKREKRKQAAIDDYAKVLKIEDRKPLQIYLALKWIRQSYDNRVMFLKNQCGMSAEEASQEIHELGLNIVKESGALVKTIEAGEFDIHGDV